MTKKTSFPGPWAARPRTPHTRIQPTRILLAGVVAGVGVTLIYGLRDIPVAVVIVAALAVALLLVIIDPGKDLMATVAPLPEVRGPRHARDGEIPGAMDLANAVRTRRGLVEGDDTATTALPQVKP